MGDISRPAAKDFDANKLWAQKWANMEQKSQRLGATIDWAINEHISWRSAYTTNETKRAAIDAPHNTLQSNTSYNQELIKIVPSSKPSALVVLVTLISILIPARYRSYLNHRLAL